MLGIAALVESRGQWFHRLQEVLSERDSNNPATVVEPGAQRFDTPTPPPPPAKRKKGKI